MNRSSRSTPALALLGLLVPLAQQACSSSAGPFFESGGEAGTSQDTAGSANTSQGGGAHAGSAGHGSTSDAGQGGDAGDANSEDAGATGDGGAGASGGTSANGGAGTSGAAGAPLGGGAGAAAAGTAGSGGASSAGTSGAGASSGGTSGAGASGAGMGGVGTGGTAGKGGGGGTGGVGGSANAGSAGTSGSAGGTSLAGAGGGPSLPPACDYVELTDTLNGSTLESTNLTISASSIVCGKLNTGHYGTQALLVDADNYGFTLPTNGNYIIKVDAPGTELLTNVTLEVSGVEVPFSGGHAVIGSRLRAGNAWVTISAYNNAGIAASLPYTVSISPDTSCPTITAPANYSEAHDGTDNRGNDVYLLNEDLSSSLTTSATDVPEPTGLTLLAGSNYRLSGLSANVGQIGSYLDGDAYAFKTGPTTNQLAIRLDWPGSTRDLDYVLYEEGGSQRLVYSSYVSNSAYEFKTLAVKPNTTYHLWVATWYESSNLPVAYDASICASSYAFP